MKFTRLLALTCLSIATTMAAAQVQQGITKDEVVIGTIQDLSGPLAGYGKQARNGMLMAMTEINDVGGVNGRKIKLIVEDASYDPKKAVLSAQKLVNQDKIFMMLGSIGTAQNLAAMPILFEKEIINFFPLAAAREMYEPFHRLKFSSVTPYYEQMLATLPELARQKNVNKICIIHQDDEFGLEVLRGAQDGLKMWSMGISEITTFKRGATDFSSQVARLKNANCELVVLGTIIRETVGVMAEARKTGFSPIFLSSSAAYSELIPKLGGKLTEGLYSASTGQLPYADAASSDVRYWVYRYRKQFNEDPSTMSAFGYATINTFALALRNSGPRPTTSKFIRAMETVSIPNDIFGGPALKFTPSKRWGSHATRVSQIQDGRWNVVIDYKSK